MAALGALVGQASACPLAIIWCDIVRKPKSGGVLRNNGAQAGVPVPLKRLIVCYRDFLFQRWDFCGGPVHQAVT